MSTRGYDYTPFPVLDPDFVRDRMPLTWSALRWGLEHGWLRPGPARRLAETVLRPDDETAVELALSEGDDDALLKVVTRHAALEVIPTSDIEDKWMHLAVAWLYRNREMFKDPFSVIETIWERFHHADALSPLIPWMPAPRGAQTGIAAMFESWKQYAEAPI